MDKPISFSGYKRYVTCPKYYYYHDIKKLRPTSKTSALIFGSIVDDVINDVLLGKTDDPIGDLNGSISDILNSKEEVTFYPDDFDKDLVDLEGLAEYAQKLGWKGDDLPGAIKTFIIGQDTISKKQRDLIDKACWESLIVKGTAMIKSFQKWVQPNIAEVYDVQKHLTYDVNGTVVQGYLDFTCKMHDGRKVLFDVKTSKMSYRSDAVLRSPQLALYAKMAGYEYAGFIVLCKTLNKNKVKTCPSCGHSITGTNISKCNARIDDKRCNTPWDVVSTPTSFSQIMVEKLSEENKDLIIEAISDTIDCIDAKKFPRNLNNCYNMYGKPCPFVDKCWKKEDK